MAGFELEEWFATGEVRLFSLELWLPILYVIWRRVPRESIRKLASWDEEMEADQSKGVEKYISRGTAPNSTYDLRGG